MEPLHLPAGYLSAHQVAQQLGIELPAVRQLVHRKQLRHAGGSKRQPWYDRDEVIALLRERQQAVAA